MTPYGHCPRHRCPLREPMEAVCTIGGCRLCAFEDLPSPNDWCGLAARFWLRPMMVDDGSSSPIIFDSDAFYADRGDRLTARDTWDPAVANDTANSAATSIADPVDLWRPLMVEWEVEGEFRAIAYDRADQPRLSHDVEDAPDVPDWWRDPRVNRIASLVAEWRRRVT